LQERRALNAYIRTIGKSSGADLDLALGFHAYPTAVQTRILDALMDSFPAMSHQDARFHASKAISVYAGETRRKRKHAASKEAEDEGR
jgi:hypothetical protein